MISLSYINIKQCMILVIYAHVVLRKSCQQQCSLLPRSTPPLNGHNSSTNHITPLKFFIFFLTYINVQVCKISRELKMVTSHDFFLICWFEPEWPISDVAGSVLTEKPNWNYKNRTDVGTKLKRFRILFIKKFVY